MKIHLGKRLKVFVPSSLRDRGVPGIAERVFIQRRLPSSSTGAWRCQVLTKIRSREDVGKFYDGLRAFDAS
jgi:hypothetical protein